MNKDANYLYKNCRLCTDHFEDMMFANALKNRLKTDAKPTLFSIPNAPPTVGTKRRTIKRVDQSHIQGKHQT